MNDLIALAKLARKTMAERLTRDEGGQLRFVTRTVALPERIAVLRSTGIPTADIIAQYPELTAIDVKIARIASMTDELGLLHVDGLSADVVARLHELAALYENQTTPT
ncbi:MAG: hypothetical protein ACO1OB_01195 [Archangium sp.]